MFSEDTRQWGDWTFSADNKSARTAYGIYVVSVLLDGRVVYRADGRPCGLVTEDSDVKIRQVANELLRRQPAVAVPQVSSDNGRKSKPCWWVRLYNRLMFGEKA